MPARSPKMNQRHFRVPRRDLVTEVHTGLRQLSSGDRGHGRSPMVVVAAPTGGQLRRSRQGRHHRRKRVGFAGSGRWTAFPPRQPTSEGLCASRGPTGVWPSRCTRNVRARYTVTASRRLAQRLAARAATRSSARPVAVGGMGEAEARGVQSAGRSDRQDAVQGVAQDRMTDCGEVNADLERPARLTSDGAGSRSGKGSLSSK